MIETDQVAILVVEVVIRGQVFAKEFATVIAVHVAEFATQHYTPVAHEPWYDSGILVRCDVPVVRRADVDAGFFGDAERGYQQARLAAIIEREDIVFGATLENGILYISLEAEADWEGTLQFGDERHKTILKLPLDYPRINQFPEWYTVSPDKEYEVSQGNSRRSKVYSGEELAKGLAIKLEPGELLRIKVIAL